jgi:hypothetical protein
MDDRERPHAAFLVGALVEWVEGLGVPPWVREAVVSSLEGGTLARIVWQALSEARGRGQHDTSHPTPVVEVGEPARSARDHFRDAAELMRPTLPTVPPGTEPPTARRRSLTARRFPPPVD